MTHDADAARASLARLLNAFDCFDFDPTTDVLAFHRPDLADHSSVVDPVALLRHLELAAEEPFGATFVMSGTPMEAAAKLLMVHLDEDLCTGKNPYRHFTPS